MGRVLPAIGRVLPTAGIVLPAAGSVLPAAGRVLHGKRGVLPDSRAIRGAARPGIVRRKEHGTETPFPASGLFKVIWPPVIVHRA
jgi:hypothetical protein